MPIEQLQPDLKLAAALFDSLDRATRRGRGVVRDSYGDGEQAAHDIMRAAADHVGLQVSIDAIGNLMMTLPGRDRSAPRIMIGSHLDSVLQGGNYDGAAGVVAGLCVLSALKQSGTQAPCDITVMGIRAEESAWFDIAYLGSGGAFGLLDPACLSIARSDNGKSLESTLIERGFDPQPIRERRPLLDATRIRAYLELHIEQGPTLVAEKLPAAVVTGIRGCKRFRNARCVGRYGHSGAVNRPHRHDAVAATVALLHHLESVWLQHEKAGADLVVTSGELYTDPAMHGPSKIAGETHFVIDIRSVSAATMEAVAAEAMRAAARIGEAYRVDFDLGATSDSPPAVMDERLRAALRGLLRRPYEMASGAGHDAAVFAKMGIPTGMIFVRNDHGSHNPDEAMTLDDFGVGAQALLGLLLNFPLT
ncbi:MAG TPA: Zn-dependent hydrolase [Steroidobacteraceae bacterium]|jgi:N-carbamoyl-L-amino-acid hydrolase|nr:Zn-dependent hydrolase [Steroidobacteraceae bacterium]